MKTRTLWTFLVILSLAAPTVVSCRPAQPPTSTVTPTAVPTATPTAVPTATPTLPPTATPTPEPTPTRAPCAPATEGPLAGIDPRGQTVVWWHPHSGDRQAWLDQAVATFNATNECGITLIAEYQGGYDEIRNKMSAAIASGELPGLVAGYQNDQAFYALANALVDLDVYVDDPVWGLTPEEKADFFSLEQGVHPALGGARLGFPPNRSMEVIFYNNTWGEELGFADPPAAPS